MPFFLVTLGVILVAVGANNTYAQFLAQLKADALPFSGYVIAIGGVGALGYIDKLRELSHYIMALIIISLILSNKGFFNTFTSAIKNPVAPQSNATGGPAATGSTATPGPAPSPGTPGALPSGFGTPFYLFNQLGTWLKLVPNNTGAGFAPAQ